MNPNKQADENDSNIEKKEASNKIKIDIYGGDDFWNDCDE